MTARVLSMAIRIISVLLLPIWLDPSDIGYIALILACINLPIAFSDLGFGSALIKQKDLDENDYRAVYTLNVVTGLILVVVLFFGAGVLSSWMDAPDLAKYLPIAVWAIPFSVFAIVPNAKLQKDLRFVSLAKRDFIGELAYSLITVILAAAGFGVYCVAIGLIAHRFVRFLLARIAVDWKPALVWRPSAIRKMFGFSFYQSLSLIFTQLFYNLDKILLATFLSPTALGYYNLSYQVGVSPIYSLMGTVKNVFFAAFVKIQDNLKESAQIFGKILKYSILLPVAISAVGMPWIQYIPVVYGEKWADAVPIAQFLFAFSVIITMDIYEGIVIAIGKVRVRVISSFVRLVLMVGALCLLNKLVTLTPLMVAICLVSCCCLAGMINLFVILRKLQFSWRQFFSTLRAVPGVLLLLGISLFLTLGGFLNSIWSVIAFFILICAFLVVFFRKDIREGIRLILKR